MIINVPLLINVNDVFRYFKFKNAGRVRNLLKTESIRRTSHIPYHFNYGIRLQQPTSFAVLTVLTVVSVVIGRYRRYNMDFRSMLFFFFFLY